MRLALLASLVFAAPLAAQAGTEPGTFGINLSVAGGETGISASWRVSPNVTLRPGVTFSWNKTTSPFGGGNEENTIWGLGLDALFRAASWDRVTTYAGLGGSYSHANGSSTIGTYGWTAHVLFGARIKVVDRVWVFGEVAAQYLRSDGFFTHSFELDTQPLGVTLFLK